MQNFDVLETSRNTTGVKSENVLKLTTSIGNIKGQAAASKSLVGRLHPMPLCLRGSKVNVVTINNIGN